MDPLLTSDRELAGQVSPAEKLAQALEMMTAGIRLKRASLRHRFPAASDAEIAKIGQAIQSTRDSVANGTSIMDPDMPFHLAVAEAAHNGVLQNAVQLLRNLMRQWIYLKLLIPDVHTRVLRQHEAIYDEIRARDAEDARSAMLKHLNDTVMLVTQVMQQRAGHSHPTP